MELTTVQDCPARMEIVAPDCARTEFAVRDNSPFLQLQMNWGAINFNTDTNSWDDYMALFNRSDPLSQALILQTLSEQPRFPRASKLSLYHQLLSLTPSIKVLEKTCRIVNSETNINTSILQEKQYLEWVDNQYYELTISNYTGSIRSNQNDVV